MKDKEPWLKDHDERVKIHDRKGREKLIEFYAPREPLVMQTVLGFLEVEKKLPIRLVHRIFDVLASATVVTKVMSAEEIYGYINNLPEEFPIAAGPCACRLDTAGDLGPDARDFAAGRLDMFRDTPIDVDIQIGTCGEKFGKLKTYRMIDKKELLEIEDRCQNMGLVSNVYVIRDGDAGICHCSSPTCAPFLANEAIGYKSKVIIHGDSLAYTDKSKCEAAGCCMEVCHFKARRIINGNGRSHSSLVSPDRCYGCGQCIKVCPNNAISMVPRKEWPEYVTGG
jgi:NAD-dependent dihydropyrimidine dehydrogenase PreA subunit